MAGMPMRRTYKIIFGAAALLIAGTLTGCFQDRAKIEKSILEQDPNFQKMLDSRNFLQEGIESRYKVYQDKTKEIDAQIQMLKERKAQVRAIYLEFIAKLKRQFDAERKLLQQTLAEYRRQLTVKREEVRSVDKDIKEVSGIVRKKEKLELTREEVQVWQNKLSSLLERKSVLEREAGTIGRNIRITELKIKVYTLRYRE